MKFNYKNLQALDMVCCAGKSPFATITRIVTAGWKKALDYNIAVHTGIVFDVHGQKLVAEMQPKGLEVHSLEKYAKVGGRRWVINMRRHASLNANSKEAQAKIALDLRRRLEYDYKGLFEFVSKRVKDNKKRAYCSEYYYQVTKDYVKYPKAFKVKVSPFDLQACSGFFSVADWKL